MLNHAKQQQQDYAVNQWYIYTWEGQGVNVRRFGCFVGDFRAIKAGQSISYTAGGTRWFACIPYNHPNVLTEKHLETAFREENPQRFSSMGWKGETSVPSQISEIYAKQRLFALKHLYGSADTSCPICVPMTCVIIKCTESIHEIMLKRQTTIIQTSAFQKKNCMQTKWHGLLSHINNIHTWPMNIWKLRINKVILYINSPKWPFQ